MKLTTDSNTLQIAEWTFNEVLTEGQAMSTSLQVSRGKLSGNCFKKHRFNTTGLLRHVSEADVAENPVPNIM